MKACPHCGGDGTLRQPQQGSYGGEPSPPEPCPAEHVVVRIAERHPDDHRDITPPVLRDDPAQAFFADPASVMWWCRVHKQMACSSDHGRQDHPTHCSDWHRWGKTGYDCVMVPADEPVKSELWKEKTQ